MTIKQIFLMGTESKRSLLDSESSMSQFKNCRVRLLEFLSGVIYIPLGSSNTHTHCPTFKFGVFYGGVPIGAGSGRSKD